MVRYRSKRPDDAELRDAIKAFARVARGLNKVMAVRGRPNRIVSDNGTEFTSMVILKWVPKTGLDWHCIAPGKPTKMYLSKASTASYGPLGDACNACQVIDECLNENLFSSLAEAKSVLKDWREDYNYHRPHPSFGNLTPQEFAQKMRIGKLAAYRHQFVSKDSK